MKLLKVGMCLAAVGVFCFLSANLYMSFSASSRITTIEELRQEYSETSKEPSDAALILGAQVKQNGELSLMLKERVDMGIDLYKNGFVKKLIMSGDHGSSDYDEVNPMKEYAVSKGVPSEDIFMDHAGFSTYESMYRTGAVFDVDTVIVVTQKYHLYRAIYDGQALGLDIRGVACDQAVYRGDAYRKVRESLARVKDLGYTIIKPEPTCLGEVISIRGNGNLTNDR